MQRFGTALIFVFGIVLASGCSGDDAEGGEAGADRSRSASDMTAADIDAVCGGQTAEEHDCGDGLTVTTSSEEECRAWTGVLSGCAVTVGNLLDCNAVAPCERLEAQSCVLVYTCSMQAAGGEGEGEGEGEPG